MSAVRLGLAVLSILVLADTLPWFQLIIPTPFPLPVNVTTPPLPVTTTTALPDATTAPPPAGHARERRSFITDKLVHWPVTQVDGKPIVYIPYKKDRVEPKIWPYIKNYMKDFRAKSCVRWVERPNATIYVNITSIPEEGTTKYTCRGDLGYMGHWYPMSLYVSDNCVHLDTSDDRRANIAHEMMHNLGFIHEHQRTDRDCYVYITGDYANDELNYGIFTTYPTDESFPYDVHSIMQYDNFAGQLHSKFGETLGQVNNSLSDLDWMKLNYMYCDGPHVCDVDPDLCEKHRKIKEECRDGTTPAAE